MKKTPIILGGLLAALAVPAIASTQSESPIVHSAASLPNQVEFLKLVDKESGTNLSIFEERFNYNHACSSISTSM
jgi:hypothetical protein